MRVSNFLNCVNELSSRTFQFYFIITDHNWLIIIHCFYSGWIYCNEVLPAGGTTAELKVTFDFPKQESPDPDAPYVISDGENYSVVVVYEASPVLYDAQGNAYANWDNAEEGGN